MVNFVIKHPLDVKISKKTNKIDDYLKLSYDITFTKTMEIEENAFFIGFLSEKIKSNIGFIMTHESSVNAYRLPFAFPAVIEQIGENREISLFLVADYYHLPEPFRQVIKSSQKSYVKTGLTNKLFNVKENEKMYIDVFYKIIKQEKYKLTQLINQCAEIVLNFNKPVIKDNLDYSINIATYQDAAYGVTHNLMDERARINDGVGTFIPYGYLEEKPYAESFALMDVAKGFYPYATLLNLKKEKNFILKCLLLMTDKTLEYPWIDEAHNTSGFFHLAWGSLPVGVDESFLKSPMLGSFSDVDGHEEGPNLLSTWKYFFRVEILGEMALLENNKVLKDAFVETLLFVNKLKMKDYIQPVTYDLDTHLPVTGKEDGGSAGGAALWSLIHFTAYHILRDTYYLEEGLKGLNHANLLDFDHYYGMRVAPKPTTVGWLTKANTYAYDLTKDPSYLEKAQIIASSIFFFYYLSPHPHAYFSTLGFGYACSRERWEAFFEMVESLYNLSFFMKYNKNDTLFKLFWYARENILWALPLNGNPYGNLSRPYDSMGGEYIPYEFSTGSLGDNPGAEGGSQSLMRQIKEIYGSGEVYLAYMMFEMFARSSQRSLIIIKSDQVNQLQSDELNFITYNIEKQDIDAVINFNHLMHENYDVYIDNEMKTNASREKLYDGIKLSYYKNSKHLITLKPTKTMVQSYEHYDSNYTVKYDGFEAVTLKWHKIKNKDIKHYIVEIKYPFYTKTYTTLIPRLNIVIDREFNVEVIVRAVMNHKNISYKKLLIKSMKLDFIKQLMYMPMISENVDVVFDEHMYMYYGQELNKTAKVNIKSDYKIVDEGQYLQVQIGSLNEACELNVLIVTDENVLVYHFKEQFTLLDIDLNPLINQHIKHVIFEVDGSKGLGFSLQKLQIIKPINIQTQNILSFEKRLKDNDDYIYNLNFENSGFQYVEFYIQGISKKHPVTFLLNGKTLINDIEKKYPEKINRSQIGIYKFKLESRMMHDIKIISKSSEFKLRYAILTNKLQYPQYAAYQNI
ncbi:hypothetical protein KHQ89_05545 [Mycoplasmatota bacterium]|nr:hypothetical protein KHQ89_05545 [Mycoplasmatota bacterium]